MAGKNKQKNKNNQNTNKQPRQLKTQTKPHDTRQPEDEIKVQATKTQTVLQTQTKVEDISNNTKTEQSNTISQDLKQDSSKNIELPIDSNLGQSNHQVSQLEANHSKSQQPQKTQEQLQIPVQQTQHAVAQPEVKEVKHQLQAQHNTQPLQVVEERSAENFTQQVASQEAQHTLPENSTKNEIQSRTEEHVPQTSNIVQSDSTHPQVTENLPVQSENIRENEVHHEVEKVAQASHQAKEADTESLPQRQLEVVPESQPKAVSEKNLENILHKQEEKPLVVPQELNNTQSFVSIEGEQERERQYKQAFQNYNEVKVQKSSDKGPFVLQNKVETEKVETKSTPNEVVNQNRSQVQENKEIPIQQQGSSQVILEHSTDNIQILQHSAPVQIEVERPLFPENQVVTETICLTESVNVQKLIQTQERPLQTQKQAPKVEVKPEVVEVQEDSNVVLDINQPIQLVQGVRQVQKKSVPQQQRQPQHVQTKQEVIPQRIVSQQVVPQKVVQQEVVVQRVVQQEVVVQRVVQQEVIVERVDSAENKIFTLVQSQEIPIDQGDREINIQVSTQIPQTQAQINVNRSLSFSDLNFSVERSAGKESISGNHQSQQKQQIKESEQQTENKVATSSQAENKVENQPQNENKVVIQSQTENNKITSSKTENIVVTQSQTENKVAESQPQTLPQEVVGEVIQPIKTIEVHYTNLSQPIKVFEQSVSRPVEVLVQEKVAVPSFPQVAEVRPEPPSEVVFIPVENTSEIVINTEKLEIFKEKESNIELRQCESNLQQRQELSTSNKEAIVQEARIKQETKEHIQQQVVVKAVQNADGDQVEQINQQPKKNPSTFIQKVVIPGSIILGGGIAWGLTKSAHKSILFGAVGLVAGLITTRLLK